MGGCLRLRPFDLSWCRAYERVYTGGGPSFYLHSLGRDVAVQAALFCKSGVIHTHLHQQCPQFPVMLHDWH